uniref:ABC-type antigen peptide transporter n=1 Tax=Bursaphelenchus xylophilus TaxID=6326 RepID=A0A1I7S7I3_BURXY
MPPALTAGLLVAADIGSTIAILCAHGPTFAWINFINQISEPYNFLLSISDFFYISIIRVILTLTGLSLLLFHSSPNNVLSKLSHISFALCILFCSYSPTKLLALTENQNVPKIADYFILIQNFFLSIFNHLVWKSFVQVTASSEAYELLQEEEESEDDTEDASASRKEGKGGTETVKVIFRLLQYCRDEWLWHISGFTWLFIYSLTRIFVPYYTGQVIASVVSAETDKYAALISAVKLMVVISIVSAISGGLRGGSFEYAYARINRAVRYNLFSSLIKQDVAFFDWHKTGEITSRLTADTQTMSDTVALNINVFLRNIVQMGGSMIFMLTLCWKLSLVPFIVVPVILVASKIFGVYYDFLSEKTQEAVAHSNDVAEEVLSTMRTVRSFACEDIEADRFYQKLTTTLSVTRKKAFAYVGFLLTSELFQAIINIAVLWYGGHLVLTNQLQKDLLVSFLLYQMQLADNIRQLGEVWTGLMQSVGASRKVFEYIDRKPDIDTSGTYIPEKIVGRIEFKDVQFSYPTRPHLPILKNLSFTVEPGEVVALVGPSGSGKSSCIALLEHFYQPNAGQILVDGTPLKEFEHRFIHNTIALVGQEPILFARSVAENVAYGLDACTKAEVIEAAKLANAHQFIINTQSQYETNVGEKGSQMSGGQKQRIAIARALVRKPSILLLDEATSALDTESEHLVQEAIYKNLKGRSVILIAHRLSTVEKADKIIVINKGIVEQVGSHEQLTSIEGTYKTLVQRQMIGAEEAEPSRPLDTVQPDSDASHPISISPRSMAQSLLATSFTQSTTSLQSK